MIGTKSRKCIKNLAYRNFCASRLRNWIAVMAIALTCILFTTVAAVGISMLYSTYEQGSRMSGDRSDVGIKLLTAREAEAVSAHPLAKEPGWSEVLGIGMDQAYGKRKLEIRAANQAFAERFYAAPQVGRMPEKEKEIALDTTVLDALQIPHNLGAEVKISYSFDGTQEDVRTDTFILCGYWEGDIAVPASQAWVAKEYVDRVAAENDGFTVKDRESGKVVNLLGIYHVSFMVGNPLTAQRQAEQILEDCGIPRDVVRPSVSTPFTQLTMVGPGTLVMGILGVAALVFIGYLLIFNIFQISIARDIRFYGLLKTVGTTGRQIKGMIRRQAAWLALMGIPLGMAAGYGVSMGLVPIISQSMRLEFQVTFHPVIFAVSAAFTLLTVFISCRKPAKIAAMVSPVEAVRYTEQGTDYGRKKKRNTTRGGKIWRMALRNIFRSKKKTVLVLLSLSLSLCIFNYIFINTRSFNLEKFIAQIAAADFYVADSSYLEPVASFQENADTISDQLIQGIRSQEGVVRSGRIYGRIDEIQGIPEKNRELYIEFLKGVQQLDMYKNDTSLAKSIASLEDEHSCFMEVYGYDKEIFSKINLWKGEIDLDKLDSGHYVVAGASLNDYGKWTSGYRPGDVVTIKGVEYQVMAVGEMDFKLEDHQNKLPSPAEEAGQGTVASLYLAKEQFTQLYPEAEPFAAMADVEEACRPQMKEYLQTYQQQENPDLAMESMDDYLESFESSKRTKEAVGYTLSIVLAFIGILNYLNTTITGINARKKELAMMQSVGMTGKQVKKMLVLEGLYYAAVSVGCMGILGNLAVYLYITGNVGGYQVYSFSPAPLLVSAVSLGILAVTVPLVCYRSISRESVIERLRETE